MLTSAARDAERLPNEVAVDCYRINLAPLKSGIEEMMKRLREALGRGLRRKVAYLERLPELHLQSSMYTCGFVHKCSFVGLMHAMFM